MTDCSSATASASAAIFIAPAEIPSPIGCGWPTFPTASVPVPVFNPWPAPVIITTGAPTPLVAGLALPSGWNLLAGDLASAVTGSLGPLYRYQPGDPTYQVIQPDSALPATEGFWVYLPEGAAAQPTLTPGQTTAFSLPAHQWVMVGNGGDTHETISAADVVYTYDPVAGDQLTTSLLPGPGRLGNFPLQRNGHPRRAGYSAVAVAPSSENRHGGAAVMPVPT